MRDLALDSRRVKAGALFAALPGSKADGRSFVAAAAKAGAVVILAPEGSTFADLPAGVAVIDGEGAAPRAGAARRALLRQPAAEHRRRHRHQRQDLDGRRSRAQLWTLEGREAASLGTLGIISRRS